MSGFQPVPPRHNTPAAAVLPEVIPEELSSCPLVFIHKDGHIAPLAPLYEGPYKVLFRSLKTFQLQVGKRIKVVSVQRLKPAFTADDEAPVAPPRRGRPPRQPPLVPPDPPRHRGRPRKVVTKSSAVVPPKRKKVTFKLKPRILNQSASTLHKFIIASLRLQPLVSSLRGVGVMWKTTPHKTCSTRFAGMR